MLDEPTSGLDSFRATGICQILHKLAREKGKTIISAIHQPSSQSFEYFDKLILMSEGNIVFQGTAMRSQRYLTKLGFEFKPFRNPTDEFMKILAVTYPKSAEEVKKLKYLIEKYDEKLKPKVLKQMEEL